MPPHLDTNGWFAIYEVKELCNMCIFRLNDHRMSTCEHGQPQFPAAHKCPHFKMELS